MDTDYKLEGIEATLDYPHALDYLLEELPDLTEDQALRVLGFISSTCKGCLASSRRCQCWNDD